MKTWLMMVLTLAAGCETRHEASESLGHVAAESLQFVEKDGLCFALVTAARGNGSDGVAIAMVQIPCATERAASAETLP